MADERAGRSRQVYGVHAVRALIEKRPGAILDAKVLRGSKAGAIPELVRALNAHAIPVERLQRADLDRISQHASHQGVIVRTRGPQEIGVREFEEIVIARGRSLVCLMLDGIQDPRNLGACLRTADAAGADAVVVPRRRAAGLTPAALKAAAGAAETVPLVRVSNLAATLRWLKDAGAWIVGADGAASRSVYQARLEVPIVLAVGGEGRGLKRLTRALCDEVVSIPMQGTVESLNVAVATAVVLFELRRQMDARALRRRR